TPPHLRSSPPRRSSDLVNTQGDPARAGFGPPPNDSLNATVWYQTSAERDMIYAQTYRAAGRVLEQALADESWDALPRGERAAARSEEHTSELQSRENLV